MTHSGKKSLSIEQTQTNLSELFGVTRPSLSRTILEMEKQEILRWSRDLVTILDLKKLNEILGR
jgi:DNA-binding MarR family transcriptional regulator